MSSVGSEHRSVGWGRTPSAHRNHGPVVCKSSIIGYTDQHTEESTRIEAKSIGRRLKHPTHGRFPAPRPPGDVLPPSGRHHARPQVDFSSAYVGVTPVTYEQCAEQVRGLEDDRFFTLFPAPRGAPGAGAETRTRGKRRGDGEMARLCDPDHSGPGAICAPVRKLLADVKYGDKEDVA